MRFVWDEQNTAPLALHGVAPDLAERVFMAEDRLMFAVENEPTRFIVEGTVDAKTYRMVWALAAPDVVYPITAFRIARSRRREP